MPTRKIKDLTPTKFGPCMHPEHNPPSHMVYTDGVYEHTCPSCGHVQTFTVLNPSLRWSSGGTTSGRMSSPTMSWNSGGGEWSAAC